MSISRPKVTMNIIPAFQTAENDVQKILFVGQQTSSGTATTGQLYTSIDNASQEDTLFGADSMIATAIRAAKNINKITRIDAIPLDDAGAAVNAAGVVDFTGSTATATGTISISIGSSINNTYNIAVTSSDSATVIGDALVTALTADTTALVSGINTTGSVAITAVNGGEEGNNISIKSVGTVAGVSVALTAMTSGATNPTLTNVFDVVGLIRYQAIVWPASYTLSIVKDFLDARFSVNNRILDGVAYQSLTDTFANLKVTAAAENSQSVTLFGNSLENETLYKGSAIFEMDYVIASQFAAIQALRLTPGTEISQYVISSQGALDATGGVALASKPYFNTPFEFLPIIESAFEFTDLEVIELADAGMSVLGNNTNRNGIIASDIVTTYKTNAASEEDLTYKYLNYVQTIVNAREYFSNNLKNRFAQSRLTLGDLTPGRDIANSDLISGYLNVLFQDLGGVDYVLVPIGENARRFFNANKTITLDLSQGLSTIKMRVPINVQLREIVGEMQISFSTTS